MSPRVLTLSRASLDERRSAILRALGTTADQLRRARELRGLTSEEWDALEELDEIDFLFGDGG
jgi:hypothetical protein